MAADDLASLTADSENLRRVASANPGFEGEPGLAVALARSGATQEQIRAVGGFLQGMQLAVKVANAREAGIKLDFTDNDRGTMAASGVVYNDVDKQAIEQQAQQAQQPTHRGILGTLSNVLNNATNLTQVKKVFHFFDRANDVVHGGGRVAASGGLLNAAGVDLGPLNHPLVGGNLADANAAENQQGMAANGYQPGNIISTLAFYSRGDQVYHPMDDLRRQYSPDLVRDAQQYLESPQDFVAPNLTDDELARRQKLLQDDKFQTLVEQVNSRHISPGRDLATAAGLHPGDEVTIGGPLARAIPHSIGGALTGVLNKKVDAYNILSGSIDGVYSFAADPTIVLGKVGAATRLARYGIRDLNDKARIEDLMRNNGSIRNGWQKLLDNAKVMRKAAQPNASLDDKAAAAAAYAQVETGTPELVPMLDEINGGGLREGVPIDTYDDLVNHVTGTVALTRMTNGIAAMDAPLMPGALPRIGYRAVKANLAGKLTGRNLKALDLEKRADQFISNNVDAVNGLGADQTGLDAAVTASADAAATGDAALKWRRTWKGRIPTMVNRLTTLLPEKNTINLSNGDSIQDIKRFAGTFMPRAHANLLAAKFATASLGERKTIADAVWLQTMHAAGIPSTTSGAAWLKRVLETKKIIEKNAAYDNSGMDRDKIAGANGEPERRAALYEGQTSTDFWIPNYADMRRMSAKSSIYDFTLRSAMESHMMDAAMGSLRTSWLVSPSSAVRNGIENIVSAHFRGASPDELAASRAALSTVLAKRVADKALAVSKQEVDERFRPIAGTLRGVWQGKIVSGMKRAESSLGRRTVDDELLKRASELVDDQMGGELSDLMAMSGLATRGDARDVEDMVGALEHGWKVRDVRFRNAGYKLDSADGNGGAKYWANQLGIRFSGSEAQHVLKAAVDDSPESRQALVDFMLSDEYKTARAKLERFGTLKDGTAVGDDPNMIARAAHELADDQIEDMKSLITGRNGAISADLVKKLQSGDSVGVDFLQSLGENARPEQVIRPKWVPNLDANGNIKGNVVQALTDAGYHYAVAKPLAWMSTLPIYHANYVKAYRRIETALKDTGVGEAHIRDVARQHAMDLTVQMIDNPRVRSQMSVITRNVFNFWRAQEDFMRRWGRNLRENPAALRELQLAVEGGMHSGLVHKDDQGNLLFSYPGSGWAIQSLGKALAAFGLGDQLGLATIPNMTTKLQFLNAGLDRPFIPTTSPVASIPLRVIKHFTHEQTSWVQAVQIGEGQIGASRNWWSQFIPSPVYRFLSAEDPDEQEGQFASAARNAFLNLFHAGLAPDANATPDEQDEFRQRVQNGIKNHLVARAMLALFLPGAPSAPTEETDTSRASKLEEAAFNTVSLKQEFSQWVNQYGYQRALALWTATHPDDLIYTVATTEGKGGTGGFLAPTDEVLKWMKQNPDLVQKYPSLAAYFAPDGPGDFSDDAWRAELESGLRQHKDLATFYRDVAVKNAETFYYQQRDKRDKAVAQANAVGNTDYAKAVKSAFSDWVDTYKKANPLLLEKWQEGDQNKTRLAHLTDEVAKLSADPAVLAKIDPNGDIANLAAAYKTKFDFDTTHDARTKEDRAYQDRVNTAYIQYIAKVLQRSPQLIPLYQGVYDRVE